MNSLLTAGIEHIQIWKEQHILSSPPAIVNIEQGGCLLKVIVCESHHLDSGVVANTVHCQLGSLGACIKNGLVHWFGATN